MSKTKMNGKLKKEQYSDDEDMPLARRASTKIEKTENRKRLSKVSIQSEPANKKVKKESVVKTEQKSPKKSATKDEEPVWEWWKEEKSKGGQKWKFLEHKGPCFAPEYEPLPSNVHFIYDGKVIKLKPQAEEAATFYAKMFDHEFTTKETFNNNFMKDWQKLMNKEERLTITDLSKCNFKPMQEYFKSKSEERKSLPKEDKDELKRENEALTNLYGYCMMDKYRQKIGNFRIEPPGLFRGRGDHPKMGSIKKRVIPRDVTINCSVDSVAPKPPPGTSWKEVRHDNKVTWLASWVENVQKNCKYIMLNASSRLKGEKDWIKYETARKLHGCIERIRAGYNEDMKSHEMKVRQRAVALYFIDKLALRAGNEKGDEEADTVGCCSLRVEHISLTEKSADKTYEVTFDFFGKDSIRYFRKVSIPKKVYSNLKRFVEKKKDSDELFDRLNTTILNQYLKELMDGLTAKVFRTYNASMTLEKELISTGASTAKSTMENKLLDYNRANRSVAVLCNHQRAPPKTFEKSMENLDEKMTKKRDELTELKKQGKEFKELYKRTKEAAARDKFEKVKKKMEKTKDMLAKMEVQKTDRTENKDIALGTSKLNYLDPRISIAWCKRHEVPISKIYNKTQLQKFQWAIDMARKDYQFCDLESDKSTNQLQKASDSDEEEGEDDD